MKYMNIEFFSFCFYLYVFSLMRRRLIPAAREKQEEEECVRSEGGGLSPPATIHWIKVGDCC